MLDVPELPSAVVTLPDTDVAALWERFQPFEPLHHQMDIMNPMSSDELDEVIAALAPRDGATAIDIACGHGELLLRLAGGWEITGTGVDLSPWQIRRCALRGATAELRGSITWILGEGFAAPSGPFTVATSLGASWIWHGFRGTASALHRRVEPRGRVDIGDLRLAEDGDPGALTGSVLTRTDQLAVLADVGLTPLAEVTPSGDAWEGYCAGTIRGANAYAVGNEGDPWADRRALAREWLAEFEKDSTDLTW